MMSRLFACLLVATSIAVAFGANDAEARGWFRRGGGGGGHLSVPAGHSNATCQDVANAMAAMDRMGHMGGNRGCFEGVGCGPTKEASSRTCFHADRSKRTIDIGFAQGKSGRWYCCRRLVSR